MSRILIIYRCGCTAVRAGQEHENGTTIYDRRCCPGCWAMLGKYSSTVMPQNKGRMDAIDQWEVPR